MKVKFISVGKIKEKYYTSAINDNIKNLRKYAQVEVYELVDEKCPEKLSDKEMEQVKDKEGDRILNKVNDDDYVIALAIEGKQLDDHEFEKLLLNIDKPITLIIGGSLGLSKKVLSRSNYKLSFSNMTFPHQMMKVLLTEKVLGTLKAHR